MDDLENLGDDADRQMIGLLARSVVELTAVVGQLNALVGMEREEYADRHVAINEELLDVATSATRAADHLAPPEPPQER